MTPRGRQILAQLLTADIESGRVVVKGSRAILGGPEGRAGADV